VSSKKQFSVRLLTAYRSLLTSSVMEIAIIVVVFGVASLFVLFLLARKVLRLAIRLALGSLLVLILIAGAAFWWWSNSGNSSGENTNRPATTPARRNSSR
jgi:hypothetical protein